jgi:alpha-amylase/alpha-mannosidase (GH57 family)
MENKPLNVVLLWHMHQPEYRNLATGEYHLPWTYLHAIKDYADMAAHLERHSGARAVVNFAPILLDQIEDYASRIKECLRDSCVIPDPLLNSLISDKPFIKDKAERLSLILACSKVNEERLIKRYPPFENLIQIARKLSTQDAVCYLDPQFFIDLVVWYHLAWMGETIRKDNAVINRLIDKGHDFSPEDRRALIEVISETLSNIIPRYRKLAEEGKVELIMSPYAHPMLPLLLDFNSMREAIPEAALPETPEYPGGEARARWHIEEGLRTFEHYFGHKPIGCWPSEGGVSTATVKLLDEYGFKWAASGDNVLSNSGQTEICDAEGDDCRHVPYSIEGSDIRLFFRDDGLSDLIGFTYSNWHADDAVGDLIQHLKNIRTHCKNPAESVVSIILDGENAWEYYPENAHYFLDALYQRLSEDPDLNLTTYSNYLETQSNSKQLPRLVAGSWVYGSFSTWMGDPDKNRAWDLLCEAKLAYDAHLQAHPDAASNPELLKQLAVCEGSDWFWWFGDYNSSSSVRDFDDLYRLNLQNLYRLMDRSPPAELDEPISKGTESSETEAGGVMRRGG